MSCAVSPVLVGGSWVEEGSGRREVEVGAVVLGRSGILGEVEMVMRGVALVRVYPGMGRVGVAGVPCEEVTVVVRPGDILSEGERAALGA